MLIATVQVDDLDNPLISGLLDEGEMFEFELFANVVEVSADENSREEK